MRVVLSTEATTGPPTGVYHLLGESETRSLCGTVNADSLFGIELSTVLTREEAERQGSTRASDVYGRYHTQIRSTASNSTVHPQISNNIIPEPIRY
jgi:hypothetical protein